MGTLSLVIPAYNAEHALPASLASVAAQTRAPDEVVVVDDGSSDATRAVASAWSDRLPLRVLGLDENIGGGLGAGAARHEGISATSGEVIALLDADDVMLPDHLEVMERAHQRHGGLVTANHLLWIPGRALGSRPAAELVPVPRPEDQWTRILSENFVFVATMFDRSLYDRVGGFRSMRCEDWDLWIRMVESGARVHMPDQVTALYRGSPGSVSAGDRLLIGDIDLLHELRGRLTGADRRTVDRALRRRRAKRLFLEGVDQQLRGDRSGARRSWLRAIATDPSPRRNNSNLAGSVGLRALACIAAPQRMVDRRDRRQRSADHAVGDR